MPFYDFNLIENKKIGFRQIIRKYSVQKQAYILVLALRYEYVLMLTMQAEIAFTNFYNVRKEDFNTGMPFSKIFPNSFLLPTFFLFLCYAHHK